LHSLNDFPSWYQVAEVDPQYEKIAYSYGEQAAYLTVLWGALIVGIIYFLMKYANRSLFKWHTVRTPRLTITSYPPRLSTRLCPDVDSRRRKCQGGE
jgi:hypothetical protein